MGKQGFSTNEKKLVLDHVEGRKNDVTERHYDLEQSLPVKFATLSSLGSNYRRFQRTNNETRIARELRQRRAMHHPFAFNDTIELALERTDCKSLAKLLTPADRLIIWPHDDVRPRVWWPFVPDDPLRTYVNGRRGEWLPSEAAWAVAAAAIPKIETRARALGYTIVRVPSPADRPYHNAVVDLWYIDNGSAAPIAIAEFDVSATARRCGLATGYQTHLLRRSKFRLTRDIELLTLVTAVHSKWPKLLSRPVSPLGLADELRQLGAIVNEHSLDEDLQQRWREMPVAIIECLPQKGHVEIRADVRNPRH